MRFDGCTKRYGRRRPPALDGLRFDVRRGRITALLGPNGSGKSTAFRAALGLVRLDEGTVEILGAAPAELQRVMGRIGAQLDGAGWPRRTPARTVLELLATMADLPDDRVDTVLGEVGLVEAGSVAVGALSLGMRRRLSLAVALLRAPELLVLDEPANGLDPAGAAQLRSFLRAFADGGGTVLLASHVLAEVAQVADDVVIISRGRVVDARPLADLHGERSAVVVRVEAAVVPVAFDVLTGAGHAVRIGDGPTDLVVRGATAPERINELLGRHGIWVHHLAHDTAALEQHYLALVGDGDATPWGR